MSHLLYQRNRNAFSVLSRHLVDKVEASIRSKSLNDPVYAATVGFGKNIGRDPTNHGFTSGAAFIGYATGLIGLKKGRTGASNDYAKAMLEATKLQKVDPSRYRLLEIEKIEKYLQEILRNVNVDEDDDVLKACIDIAKNVYFYAQNPLPYWFDQTKILSSMHTDAKELDDIKGYLCGFWHVLRYSIEGTSIVLGLLTVYKDSLDKQYYFQLYYRGLDDTNHGADPQVAEGPVLLLHGKKNYLMMGLSQKTKQNKTDEQKYPVIILCHTVKSDKSNYFYGIIERESNDNSIYAAKTYFSRVVQSNGNQGALISRVGTFDLQSHEKKVLNIAVGSDTHLQNAVKKKIFDVGKANSIVLSQGS